MLLHHCCTLSLWDLTLTPHRCCAVVSDMKIIIICSIEEEQLPYNTYVI